MATIDSCAIDLLFGAFASGNIPVGTERAMQQAVGQVLRDAGVPFEPERRLAPRDRIDFLLGSGIGIETKIGGSYIEVASQLLRYAESPLVTGLILVTNRASHRQLDNLPNEKHIPIRVYFVGFNGI